MGAVQTSIYDTTIFLSLEDEPALTVLPADVVLRYKKVGQDAFVVKTLDTAHWINLGDGYYSIRWTSQETDTLGSVFYVMSSVKFDNFLADEFDVEIPTSEAFGAPSTCLISGNVSTLEGKARAGLPIIIRGVDFPLTSGYSMISSELVRTFSDEFGNFSMSIARGATVTVEIERAGFKLQIVVPDQPTAALVDLVPPLN